MAGAAGGSGGGGAADWEAKMNKLKEMMIKHGFAPQVRRATSDDMRKWMTGERFTDDSVPFEDTFAGRYYAAEQSAVVKEALAGMATDRGRVRVLKWISDKCEEGASLATIERKLRKKMGQMAAAAGGSSA